jgi:hypothetical protein
MVVLFAVSLAPYKNDVVVRATKLKLVGDMSRRYVTVHGDNRVEKDGGLSRSTGCEGICEE